MIHILVKIILIIWIPSIISMWGMICGQLKNGDFQLVSFTDWILKMVSASIKDWRDAFIIGILLAPLTLAIGVSEKYVNVHCWSLTPWSTNAELMLYKLIESSEK